MFDLAGALGARGLLPLHRRDPLEPLLSGVRRPRRRSVTAAAGQRRAHNGWKSGVRGFCTRFFRGAPLVAPLGSTGLATVTVLCAPLKDFWLDFGQAVSGTHLYTWL